jgi:hypothetical protein
MQIIQRNARAETRMNGRRSQQRSLVTGRRSVAGFAGAEWDAWTDPTRKGAGVHITQRRSTQTHSSMATISRSLRRANIQAIKRRIHTVPPPAPDSASLGTLPSSQSAFTPQLAFFNSILPEGKQIPTFRVLDGVGNLIEDASAPEVWRPGSPQLTCLMRPRSMRVSPGNCQS